MEIYFKLKLVTLIIPIILSSLTFAVIFIAFVIAVIKDNRIEKFFKSHGYERTLLDVSSVGNRTFYGWARDIDNKIIRDRDIKGLSLKEIKERYK